MSDLWPELREYAVAKIAAAQHTLINGKLDQHDYAVLIGGVRALQDLFKQADQITHPPHAVDGPRDIPDGFGS